MVKKVAIIGPESTGKSTLSQRLANHYQTLWVPEYARQYLTQHGVTYTYDALLTIAKGQIALEEEYIARCAQHLSSNIQHPSLLFIDTDMYVMKVWCEFVYNKCHQWILDQIVTRHYDLYLLCNIDIPWSPDVLREYPNPRPRQELFRMYHDIMINQPTPWALISGNNNERLQSAINAVDSIL